MSSADSHCSATLVLPRSMAQARPTLSMIPVEVRFEYGFSGRVRTRWVPNRASARLSIRDASPEPRGDGGLPSMGVGVPGERVVGVEGFQPNEFWAGVSEYL